MPSYFGYLPGRNLCFRLALAACLIFGVSGLLQSQVITEFPLPTANAGPLDITTGPDGNLWFTEFFASKIGQITTSGAVTEFPTPSAPTGIVTGPDGNIWFTENLADKIGRMTPGGSLIGEFSLPIGSQPEDITTGPDGNLWFTEPGTDHVARLTPSGHLTEFPISPHSGAKVITIGPDGNLWFAESTANRIGRITMAGVVTEFTIPSPNSAPVGIAALGNALWFCETATAKIGKITTAGAITEFPGLSAGSGPRGITADIHGQGLWFTEFDGNRIGRISSQGLVTEYAVPTAGSGPRLITFGPDGAVWFTEVFASKIGRIAPPDTTVLTAFGPASLWLGLKNSDDVGTKFDIKAEVFAAGSKVGEGQLNNVSGGGGVFDKAALKVLPVALSGGSMPFPGGTKLAIRVSARITCSSNANHKAGTARLWFDGKAIDSGPKKDAGSRFSLTAGATSRTYFLRSGFALDASAGSSRLFVDAPVSKAVPCPARPFTEFGTWSTP